MKKQITLPGARVCLFLFHVPFAFGTSNHTQIHPLILSKDAMRLRVKVSAVAPKFE